MAGARPRYLSAGFILEEGLPLATLRRVVELDARAAREVGVEIVTGDTKLVDRGKGGRNLHQTRASAWCRRASTFRPARSRRRSGAAERRRGPARHGRMSVREGLGFEARWRAIVRRWPGWSRPCCPWGVLHCLRDLTRGGLAAA